MNSPSDRNLKFTIIFCLSVFYLGIMISTYLQSLPEFILSISGLIFASEFAVFLASVGILSYIFGSKRINMKFMKNYVIGRYGRIFYLTITFVILSAYLLINYVLINALFQESPEKKQNISTGILVVDVLIGSFVTMYLFFVFKGRGELPSRYERHPPIFGSNEQDLL